MKWIDIGGLLVNFDRVLFIMKHIDGESQVISLKIYLLDMEHFVQTIFKTVEERDAAYVKIQYMLNNVENNMADPTKNGE